MYTSRDRRAATLGLAVALLLGFASAQEPTAAPDIRTGYVVEVRGTTVVLSNVPVVVTSPDGEGSVMSTAPNEGEKGGEQEAEDQEAQTFVFRRPDAAGAKDGDDKAKKPADGREKASEKEGGEAGGEEGAPESQQTVVRFAGPDGGTEELDPESTKMRFSVDPDSTGAMASSDEPLDLTLLRLEPETEGSELLVPGAWVKLRVEQRDSATVIVGIDLADPERQ